MLWLHQWVSSPEKWCWEDQPLVACLTLLVTSISFGLNNLCPQLFLLSPFLKSESELHFQSRAPDVSKLRMGSGSYSL